MGIKGFAMIGGAVFAAGFSQFPEYSQQYTQRLAGAVDELSTVVEMFDADAASLNMTRAEALADMQAGSKMAEARALSMSYVFQRHEKLSNDLNSLQAKSAHLQLTHILRMTDLDVARQALDDFKPAVPVTADGIGFGIAGFLAGTMLISGLMAVMRVGWSRRHSVT